MAESIRETLVQYPSDKVTIRAYVAAPQTKERRPAIIVIQEWWGLTEHIKDIASGMRRKGTWPLPRICIRGLDTRLQPMPAKPASS